MFVVDVIIVGFKSTKIKLGRGKAFIVKGKPKLGS